MKLRCVLIVLLTSMFLFGCKKKEERDLINDYIGTYTVAHTSTRLENNLIVSTDEELELKVKKSCKGIKIPGIRVLDNFDVNYTDSTFSAFNKHGQESAYGKLNANYTISVTVNLSDKLPICEIYNMKKK